MYKIALAFLCFCKRTPDLINLSRRGNEAYPKKGVFAKVFLQRVYNFSLNVPFYQRNIVASYHTLQFNQLCVKMKPNIFSKERIF